MTERLHFHALEKEMAAHSSVLAWRIPGDRGAWCTAVYGVSQSRTRLKGLSSSSICISEVIDISPSNLDSSSPAFLMILKARSLRSRCQLLLLLLSHFSHVRLCASP